jgi:RNA polymerase sigma-70 factor (ECF subfamily)
MTLTRLTLLNRLRAGVDPASWQEFHAAYEPLLQRYVASQGVPPDDVPDVVQEIFTKLLRTLKSFEYDPTRARFRTWLFRVARNQVTDWQRQRRRRREEARSPEQFVELPEDEGSFDWDAEHRQRVLEFVLETIRSESHSLSWICFAQRYLQGRTAGEISVETGLTENGVYTNAARVLMRVRNKCLQFDESLDHAESIPVSQ